MTVREFNGTSDELVTATGAASAMTYGTAAILLKFSTLAGFREFCMIHSSGNAFVANPIGLTNFSAWQVDYNAGGSDFATLGPAPSVGPWLLAVVRKPTGSAKPRLSMYNYTTGTWAHNDGNNAIGDGSAPGAGSFIRFSFQGSSLFFGGRIAARALWVNDLPWTADAAGDAAIVASGLKDSASAWAAAGPDAFWLFNQTDVTDPVLDLSTGGTADEISRDGTTAIDGDDPPGFVFSSTISGDLDAGLPALTGSLEGSITDTGDLNGQLPELIGQLEGAVGGLITGDLDARIPAMTGKLHGTVEHLTPTARVMPFAQRLADCLCAELAGTIGGAVCRCCVYPGLAPPPADSCCECPSGSQGQATVQVTRIFPSDEARFPTPLAIVPDNCRAVGWAADLTMTVYRCVPVPDEDGSPPDCAELAAAAAKILGDAEAMMNTIICCEWNVDTLGLRRMVPGQWSPMPNRGGCGGGQMSVTVFFGSVCCE